MIPADVMMSTVVDVERLDMRIWGGRTALVTSAVAATVLMGCGSGDNGTAGTGETSTTTAAGERAEELRLELVDCHQAGFPTAVDPAAANDRLLPDQDLYLDDAGNARFTLIAKDCADIIVDDVSVGSGHFTTAWVRINGPDEVRTFDEAPDTAVTATDYFVPVLFQTDNADFADAATDFGVPMTRATMTMDPPGTATRTGSARGDDGVPPVDYHWTTTGGTPFPPGPQGVVHVLEGPAGASEARLAYDIECPVSGGTFANATTIEIDPGSAIEALVGTGYQGIGPAPDLSCRATITRTEN